MSRWRVSSAAVAGFLATVILAACGGSPQDASEPNAKFTVDVARATFPATQKVTQHAHLVIVVRNPGPKAIPNPAVTICNLSCWPGPGQRYPLPLGEGTSVLSFAVVNRTPYSASHSKQVWVLDRAPNPTPCVIRPGAKNNFKAYGCASGGPGGMATAAANTWALGHPLQPGRTVVFDWWVTAVQPGHYTVAWRLAAGVWGHARAVLSNGSVPRGKFSVTITEKPQQAYVDNNGRIVQTNKPVPPPQGLNTQ